MMKTIVCLCFIMWASLSAQPLGLAEETADPVLATVQKMDAKIDSVLKNQDEILKNLAEVKEEIRIIKVRTTRP